MGVDGFIERWRDLRGGAERANYAMFLVELTQALDLPSPNPADSDNDTYRFEQPVRGNGAQPLRIDLYRRESFILEAKQSRLAQNAARKGEAVVQPDLFGGAGTAKPRRAWDADMRAAFNQAWDYAGRLPPDHDRPPFIITCDVGRSFEFYADFTGQGRAYRPFPDERSRIVTLEQLAEPAVRDRFRAVWLAPRSLDPALRRAEVTREVAGYLAQVSKSLEEKYPPEEVATFLSRTLFAMFAEDVGLLPENSFKRLLGECVEAPAGFEPQMRDLFRHMDEGGFSPGLNAAVRRFNGAFYKDRRAFPLGREEIGALLAAANKDWRDVEPAIFGTLLEEALTVGDRSRLGAHYTPRPYVERLVNATVMEPLRADWDAARAAAEDLQSRGNAPGAALELMAFHDQLTRTRVLDPACGTGNFLYVTLELMKALETEVLEARAGLVAGDAEGLVTDDVLRGVDPRQFLGLELNPRAAAIAELVLWIGYLQASYRRDPGYRPRDPVLADYATINPIASRRKRGDPCVDAVMQSDGVVVGGGGEAYPNPRLPAWPEAEFIVGNPPFTGGKDIRAEQGDAYVAALWSVHPKVDEASDLVMYWWDRAADILTRKGTKLRRFGLVTTNSITQVFQRRTLARWIGATNPNKQPLSLVFAVDDHPWTRATKGAAAVRIAMTVARAGSHDGVLATVEREVALDTDQPVVELKLTPGRI
ncbi:MAG: DNA methyltransferase, partial [Caulobacteraceae bacterium]